MNENFEIMRGLATCPHRLVLIMVEPAGTLGRVIPGLMAMAMAMVPSCHPVNESHTYGLILHFSNRPSQ